ncbi:hypothetical protein NQ015_10915 [Corynebacterium sp. 153RC1]|nr:MULTISPECIES: hypothetical protein [unclassified Corynebacterium]MCQ9366583.1 hypothetical protein [Corynebacterium sp. 70RC1]MCQ9353529.1 hypothetical protein [Corynebacterium sp. 209RC1]MCQ9355750.1 hypothetical protein [Corynebacterium sp. 1222RC1]MCQ9357915.1 hypothetical protein [Corynebacterium sp. 122RC1]MCQ9360111.1 hypothetical protein [Corynebacterium sp. 142RC1]
MVANDDGDMIVEVETEGNPAFVTVIGMLDISRDELYRRIEDD